MSITKLRLDGLEDTADASGYASLGRFHVSRYVKVSFRQETRCIRCSSSKDGRDLQFWQSNGRTFLWFYMSSSCDCLEKAIKIVSFTGTVVWMKLIVNWKGSFHWLSNNECWILESQDIRDEGFSVFRWLWLCAVPNGEADNTYNDDDWRMVSTLYIDDCIQFDHHVKEVTVKNLLLFGRSSNFDFSNIQFVIAEFRSRMTGLILLSTFRGSWNGMCDQWMMHLFFPLHVWSKLLCIKMSWKNESSRQLESSWNHIYL